MIAITKGMVALSAVLSAGFVTYDFTVSHDPSAAAQVAQRFPSAGEMFVSLDRKPGGGHVSTEKSDRSQLPAEHCMRQDWPYIAQICLTSADGKPVRTVSRIITVERRTGENSSELTRLPVATLANR